MKRANHTRKGYAGGYLAATQRPFHSWLSALGLIAMTAFAQGAWAVTCTSAATVNNWNTVGTWSCGHVPANGDDVVIAATSTTTLNANSNSLLSLTVNGVLIIASNLNVNSNAAAPLTINSGGTVTIGNNGTARAMVVTGDITVAGTFSVGATAATHTLTAGGNIINTGTINFAPTGTRVCNVTFNENGNQTVSGAGAYTFNLITLNMGATNANVLDMQSVMSAPAGFLTITNGTYKHSNASNITPWTAAVTIPASGGFWLNGAATVTATGFNVSVTGLFHISAGTMTIGNAVTTQLILNNASTFQMDGGALTVTGGLDSAATNSTGTFTMSAGSINLMTVGTGAVTSFMLGSGTTFNMSGGTITLVNGDNTTNDMELRSGTVNVTGGTLQIGSGAITAPNQFLITNGSGASFTVWNLTLAAGAARTTTLGSAVNVLNSLTIQANNTLDGGGFAINVGDATGNATPGIGNWTNNGAYTTGTSTVSFVGPGAASLGGTVATTFQNMTMNKSAATNTVTINTSPTVNATLTFTLGQIVTGANAVIVATTGTIATPSASSYVVGNLQKNYAAAANLSYFAGNDFPVGDVTSYTPVNISAGTTTTAGSLTVSTLTPDHPQVTTPIASTGIAAAKSVNRYWRFNNSGLTVGTAISATFTFVAGDVDAGANTANFIVERYDGTNWYPTTLTAANPLNTQASNITPLVAGNNDFAIGEPLSGVTAVPGAYNPFDPAPTTPLGPILGKIQTKIAGTGFSVEIVHINATKTGVLAGAITVEVRLLDSSSGGAPDVNGCNAGWTLIQAAPNFAIPASGWGTIPAVTVANSYPSVRVQIRSPVGGPYTAIGCSTDLFAIRPSGFTILVQDLNRTTAGTTNTLNATTIAGVPVHNAGQLFRVQATAVNASALTTTNYTGTSAGSASLCTNNGGTITACGATLGTFSIGTWPAAVAGVNISTTATYSEVGAFTLQLQDTSFASVDAGDGTLADCTGQYVCSSVNVGRFVPDHFAVSGGSLVNRSDICLLGTGCPSSFTYLGEPMAAVFTLTAQNATNGTTKNYVGANGVGDLAKLNPAAAGNPLGLAVAYAAVSTAAAGVGATTVTVDTTVGFVAGDALWIPGAGAAGAALNATVASLTSNTITLSTPIVTAVPLGTNIERDLTGSVTIPSVATSSSFVAGVATITPCGASPCGAPLTVTRGTTNWYPTLSVGIAPVDGDGVLASPYNLDAATVAGNDHVSIASTDVRYGQMKLSNAHGSELLQLPIAVTAQYWNGLNYVTNIADSITTLNATTVTSANWTNLTPSNWQKLTPSSTWAAGATSVVPATASVVFINGTASFKLAAPSGKTGSVDIATNAPAYLPSNSGYPARATFGVYKGANEFIYLRENY